MFMSLTILVKAISLYSSRVRSANLVILRVTPEVPAALFYSANSKFLENTENL